MKIAILFVFLLTLSVWSNERKNKLDVKSIIKIEIGNSEEKSSKGYNDIKYLRTQNRRLQSRVHKLELAVLQLQEFVFDIQMQQVHFEKKQHSCMIKTGMHGTFFGKGESKIAAKAKALKSCEKEAGEFWCNEDKVTCE